MIERTRPAKKRRKRGEKLCFEFTIIDKTLKLFYEKLRHFPFEIKNLASKIADQDLFGMFNNVKTRDLRISFMVINSNEMHKLEYNYEYEPEYYGKKEEKKIEKLKKKVGESAKDTTPEERDEREGWGDKTWMEQLMILYLRLASFNASKRIEEVKARMNRLRAVRSLCVENMVRIQEEYNKEFFVVKSKDQRISMGDYKYMFEGFAVDLNCKRRDDRNPFSGGEAGGEDLDGAEMDSLDLDLFDDDLQEAKRVIGLDEVRVEVDEGRGEAEDIDLVSEGVIGDASSRKNMGTLGNRIKVDQEVVLLMANVASRSIELSNEDFNMVFNLDENSKIMKEVRKTVKFRSEGIGKGDGVMPDIGNDDLRETASLLQEASTEDCCTLVCLQDCRNPGKAMLRLLPIIPIFGQNVVDLHRSIIEALIISTMTGQERKYRADVMELVELVHKGEYHFLNFISLILKFNGNCNLTQIVTRLIEVKFKREFWNIGDDFGWRDFQKFETFCNFFIDMSTIQGINLNGLPASLLERYIDNPRAMSIIASHDSSGILAKFISSDASNRPQTVKNLLRIFSNESHHMHCCSLIKGVYYEMIRKDNLPSCNSKISFLPFSNLMMQKKNNKSTGKGATVSPLSLELDNSVITEMPIFKKSLEKNATTIIDLLQLPPLIQGDQITLLNKSTPHNFVDDIHQYVSSKNSVKLLILVNIKTKANEFAMIYSNGQVKAEGDDKTTLYITKTKQSHVVFFVGNKAYIYETTNDNFITISTIQGLESIRIFNGNKEIICFKQGALCNERFDLYPMKPKAGSATTFSFPSNRALDSIEFYDVGEKVAFDKVTNINFERYSLGESRLDILKDTMFSDGLVTQFPSSFELKDVSKVFRRKMVKFRNEGFGRESHTCVRDLNFRGLKKKEGEKISNVYFKIFRASETPAKYPGFVIEINPKENLHYALRSDRYWRDHVSANMSQQGRSYITKEFLTEIGKKINLYLDSVGYLEQAKKLSWKKLMSSLLIRAHKDNYLLFEVFEVLDKLPFFSGKKANSMAIIELLSNYVRVRYNLDRRYINFVRKDYPLTRIHYRKKDKKSSHTVSIPSPDTILSKFARSIDLLEKDFEFDDYLSIASSHFFSFLEYLMNKKELVEEDEKCRQILVHIFKTFSNNDEFFPFLVSLHESIKPSQENTLFDKLLYLGNMEGFKKLNEIIKERSYKLGFRKKYNSDQRLDTLELSGDRLFKKALGGFLVQECKLLDLKGPHKHEFYNEITKVKTLSDKLITRINHEVKLLKGGLPCESSNSIFVKVDSQRSDVLKVLIIGSKNTPYAYGCFIFDVWFNKNFPTKAPSCRIMTGRGKIRFNPNLYSTGKVCLSLLGTWPGESYQKWNAEKSSLLQVLLSIQSLIMHEDVYFNEPSFGNYKGKTLHINRNNAYCKIAEYGTVKYAMVDSIQDKKNPFHDIIKAHFYINKKNIFDQIEAWKEKASIPESYTGIAVSHNRTVSNILKGQKFRSKLDELTKELREVYKKHINVECLSFLDAIFTVDIQDYYERGERLEAREVEDIDRLVNLDAVDKEVGRMKKVKLSIRNFEEEEEGDFGVRGKKRIDVKDEKTQQTFSRYIGVVGIEALALQARSKVLLIGLDQLGLEIAKNVVLSSLDTFGVMDDRRIKDVPHYQSGLFFLKPEDDVNLNICDVMLPRIQELHSFVTVRREKSLSQDTISKYDIIVACNQEKAVVLDKLSKVCRAWNKPLIVTDTQGLYARVVNSFGKKFEVVDITGESLQTCSFDKKSSNQIMLLENLRAFSKDDEILLYTEGKEKSKSQLNKVEEVKNGLVTLANAIARSDFDKVKQVKKKALLKNLNIHRVYDSIEMAHFEENLYFYDFEKSKNNKILNLLFSLIREKKNNFEELNSKKHFSKFSEFCFQKYKQKMALIENGDDLEDESAKKKFNDFVMNFLIFSHSYFHAVDAFVGGVVAQEVLKAATHKFKPIDQIFTLDFSDLGDSIFEKQKSIKLEFGTINEFRRIFSQLLLSKNILDSRLLVVGSGAIGCELLKNLSQINCCSGKEGRLYVTDPDFIEISNLNRQFLFRERHLRKPKSLIAAASIKNFKPETKIMPLLEKVGEATENIFTNKFWKGLDCVANALDNIKARKYVDLRCVKNMKPLVESGTLGAKGHIQTIVPFKTETYGDVQDAEENNGSDIPYCTLKLFPEKSEHCIEWARDKFETLFREDVESAKKIMEIFSEKNFARDLEQLKDEIDDDDLEKIVEKILESMDYINCKKGLMGLKSLPINQNECVRRAAEIYNKLFIKAPNELLVAYPLDMVDGEGEPFWRAPKRPPSPVNFDTSFDWHKKLVLATVDIYARIMDISITDTPVKFTESKLVKKVEDDKSTFQGILKATINSTKTVSKDELEKIKKAVDKEKSGGQVEEEEEDDTGKLVSILKDILAKYKKVKNFKDYFKSLLKKIKPEIFDKDDDANGHIDVIYGLTNCRAQSYNIQTADRITVKLKSGRIIPAMVTTTACISALEAMEIFKVLTIDYLEKKEVPEGEEETVYFRNSFLNLALPFMTRSEPAPPIKNKLDKLKIKLSIWDSVEIKAPSSATVGCLFGYLKEQLSDLEQIIYKGKTIYHKEISDKNQLELLFKQACKLPFDGKECDILAVDKKGASVRLHVTLDYLPKSEFEIELEPAKAGVE